MTATVADTVPRGWRSTLWTRQLDAYPDTAPRLAYLALTVAATITLYYELYVGGSVSTLQLPALGMTFTFYVTALAIGNLIGAFGSVVAGLSDRVGRANIVVIGLLITGIYTAFFIPYATSKWPFVIMTFIVGTVEGMCLVATPALIRDFSPQLGRASAMGFWTAGPVAGSLIVTLVGTNTIPAVVSNDFWGHEYKICGIAGLVVAVICFVGLRELSPGLRDQLMVTMRDRALIEARAKGIDVDAALYHAPRQLLKPDVVVSAVAVSVMLLIYYTAVAFGLIFLTTVFGFSVKDANGLGNWNWGFNVVGVILVGILSDALRVRKPFMVIGGVGGAVMVVVYLLQIGHHPGYYTLALILAGLSLCLGIAYTPWMASFTETVEARNPALIATGLAIWGWILRVVVTIAFLIIPHIVSTVTPLVNYGTKVQTYAAKYAPEIAFAQSHPQIIKIAQKYPTQIANAQKFAPELAVLQAHPALFTKLSKYPNPANAPAKLINAAIKAAGGGTKGISMLSTIAANQAAINGVIAVAPELTKIQPYSAQLKAVAKVQPQLAYLQAHATAVQQAAATTGSQWKRWYWVCFGGIIFFLLWIPLLRGRWSPAAARRDEEEHEEMVAAELAKLHQTKA